MSPERFSARRLVPLSVALGGSMPGSMPLDCYWVGSLDFDFLVEIKLGSPLNSPTVAHLFAGDFH